MDKQALLGEILALGADNAAVLSRDEVVLDRIYRSVCEQNGCGTYGRCYMCPPDIGDIDALIAEVRTYDSAVLYQTVSAIEDEFDIEGMLDAGRRQIVLSRAIEASFPFDKPHLHLSAGACRVCESCAKRDGEPCRHPDQALSSLEAYGVDVYKTARNASIRYINGPLTVTYFGMILLKES
jgi:predicted metal-binding protein